MNWGLGRSGRGDGGRRTIGLPSILLTIQKFGIADDEMSTLSISFVVSTSSLSRRTDPSACGLQLCLTPFTVNCLPTPMLIPVSMTHSTIYRVPSGVHSFRKFFFASQVSPCWCPSHDRLWPRFLLNSTTPVGRRMHSTCRPP
ncbi:hypothetical protein PMAYCL1PPCAC_29225 [Pristionchus mayeri]|uniref:Uncharacterized protein n=1 Tax=Pristionchus mayeri TaxID=1317129 RepID=A0AAN5DAF1_9BILA|nr:hypothetical protein PMAYCL1PPCAC_29225 [Pristionchus mayeri]